MSLTVQASSNHAAAHVAQALGVVNEGYLDPIQTPFHSSHDSLNTQSLPIEFPVSPKHGVQAATGATHVATLNNTGKNGAVIAPDMSYQGYKNYAAYLDHYHKEAERNNHANKENSDKKHDMIHDIIRDTTPQGIRYIEQDIGNVLKPINKPFLPFEQTVETDLENTLEEIYPDGKAKLKHATFAETLYFLRWILNFLFVASPYWVWSILMIALNIFMNISLNDWWAWGNAFLIYNTGYMVVQTIMSWPLIFEIPWYLEHARWFRIISFQLASLHTLVYFVVVADWVYTLWFAPEDEMKETGLLDIFVNMVLGYNIIFHLHTMFVNLAIVTKEVLLWIFPPLLAQDTNAGLDVKDFKEEFNPDEYARLFTEGKIPDEQQHSHWHIPNQNITANQIHKDQNAVGDIFGTRHMYRPGGRN